MRFSAFPCFLATLLVVILTQAAFAQSPTIVRVEEDWELTVETPDPATDAPQIACVISPWSHVYCLYAVFELNHQSLPDYQAGGLQLQLWYGEHPLGSCNYPNEGLLSQPGETIRWTQSMRLEDGKLWFEVINGTSTTWGNFGGQGYLKTSLLTAMTDLNGYDPAVSAENSGVSYADNRVPLLVLKKVRVYTSTGEEIVDETVRVVHSQD
ncbi:MAG: hypothetical protein A2V70_18485 [Planctomycetes bacterium RBG_13_63_9]|nr:MAG: hypothetical protein A2V70_18485 [Planctomycetes bacterium RBG_13_63_9]